LSSFTIECCVKCKGKFTTECWTKLNFSFYWFCISIWCCWRLLSPPAVMLYELESSFSLVFFYSLSLRTFLKILVQSLFYFYFIFLHLWYYIFLYFFLLLSSSSSIFLFFNWLFHSSPFLSFHTFSLSFFSSNCLTQKE